MLFRTVLLVGLLVAAVAPTPAHAQAITPSDVATLGSQVWGVLLAPNTDRNPTIAATAPYLSSGNGSPLIPTIIDERLVNARSETIQVNTYATVIDGIVHTFLAQQNTVTPAGLPYVTIADVSYVLTRLVLGPLLPGSSIAYEDHSNVGDVIALFVSQIPNDPALRARGFIPIWTTEGPSAIPIALPTTLEPGDYMVDVRVGRTLANGTIATVGVTSVALSIKTPELVMQTFWYREDECLVLHGKGILLQDDIMVTIPEAGILVKTLVPGWMPDANLLTEDGIMGMQMRSERGPATDAQRGYHYRALHDRSAPEAIVLISRGQKTITADLRYADAAQGVTIDLSELYAPMPVDPPAPPTLKHY